MFASLKGWTRPSLNQRSNKNILGYKVIFDKFDNHWKWVVYFILWLNLLSWAALKRMEFFKFLLLRLSSLDWDSQISFEPRTVISVILNQISRKELTGHYWLSSLYSALPLPRQAEQSRLLAVLSVTFTFVAQSFMQLSDNMRGHQTSRVTITPLEDIGPFPSLYFFCFNTFRHWILPFKVFLNTFGMILG